MSLEALLIQVNSILETQIDILYPSGWVRIKIRLSVIRFKFSLNKIMINW